MILSRLKTKANIPVSLSLKLSRWSVLGIVALISLQATASALLWYAQQAKAYGCVGNGDITITTNTTWNTSMCYNDVTIKNNATLTIAGNTIQEMTNLNVGTTGPRSDGFIIIQGDAQTGKGVEIRANNVVVQSGSIISADGQGYAAQQGPGGSATGGGSYAAAGYGGPNVVYGSLVAPISLGSGGKTTAGGGAIKISIVGSLTLDGFISASGIDPSCVPGQATGSGGSVWVDFTAAGSWAGSGYIQANGGTAYESCSAGVVGGSGGRISVTGYGTRSASAGVGNNAGDFGAGFTGAAGTIVEKSSSQSQGTLKIHGDSTLPTKLFASDPVFNAYSISARVSVGNGGDFVLPTATTFDAGEDSFITIADSSNFTVQSGATFSMTGRRYSPPANPNYIYHRAQLDISDSNTFTMQGGSVFSMTTYSIINNLGTGVFDTSGLATLSITGTLNTNHAATNRFATDVTVPYGGLITHPANTTTKQNWLDLSFTNLTLDSGNFAIDVNGKGYAAGQGPGGSNTGGGSYAAAGGNGSEVVYGSMTAPTDLGSGGAAGSGGGAVKITIAGNLVNNSTITASGSTGGNNCTNSAGTGSGGSIWINFTNAGTWSGSGSLLALPDISGQFSGCVTGSGGRIAVTGYGTDSHTQTEGAESAGNPGNQPSLLGAAGTIVKKSAAQSVGKLTIFGSDSILPTKLFSTDPNFDEYLVSRAPIEAGNGGNFVLPTGSAYTLRGGGLTTIASNSNFIVQSGASYTSSGYTQGWCFEGYSCYYFYSTLTIGSTNSFIAQSGAVVDTGRLSVINNLGTGTFDTSGMSSLTIGGTLNTDHTATNTFSPNVTVGTYGFITHPANTTTKQHWLDLDFTNLTMDPSGVIDVSGKGYAGGSVGSDGAGPGGGIGSVADGAGGGGHATAGAAGTGGAGGSTYGSAVNPITLGSGGGGSDGAGGAGGGYVNLSVSGIFTPYYGSVKANGANGEGTTGAGGAGGSISIAASIIPCSDYVSINARNSVTANGGVAAGPNAGAGGNGYTEVIAGNAADCQIEITTTSLPDTQVGLSYLENIQVIHDNPPTTFTVTSGNFPPGLYMNYNGLISGHATTPGTYSFTVEAQDQVSTDTQDLQIVVSAAPPPPLAITTLTLPDGTTNVGYNQYVYTANAVNGVTVTLDSGSLPPGLSLNQVDDNGYITGTPSLAGTYNFTIKAEDSRGSVTRDYQVTISDPDPGPPLVITTTSLPDAQIWYSDVYQYYMQYIYTTDNVGSVTFSVSSGDLPPGLSISSDASPYGIIQGTPTTPGTYTFTVQAQDSRGNGIGGTTTQEYTIVVPTPELPNPYIVTTSLPHGRVDSNYNENIQAQTTGQGVFSVTAGILPAGISLSLDGQLTGTPTAAGSYTFTVQVTDMYGSDTQELTLVVDPVPVEPTNTPFVTITSPPTGGTSTGTSLSATGTGPANKTIRIAIDGAVNGTTQTNGSGIWSYTATGLTVGQHSLDATWVPGNDVSFVPYFNQSEGVSGVQVIDNASGEVVKTINMLGYVSGVTLNHARTKLYAYGTAFSGSGGKVWEFNLSTMEQRSVLINTDTVTGLSMVVAKDDKKAVFAKVGSSTMAFVKINLETMTKEGSDIVAPGLHPNLFSNAAYSPDGSKLYSVFGSDIGNLSVIDLENNTVDILTLGVGLENYATGLRRVGNRLFVLTAQSINVLDASTGGVLRSIQVSPDVNTNPATALTVNDSASTAYVALLNGFATVDLGTDAVQFITQPGVSSYGIGVSRDGKKVYVPNIFGGLRIWDVDAAGFMADTSNLLPAGVYSYSLNDDFIGPITPTASITFALTASPTCTTTNTCPCIATASTPCVPPPCATTNTCPIVQPPVGYTTVQTQPYKGGQGTASGRVPSRTNDNWASRFLLSLAAFVPAQAAVSFPWLLFLLLLILALSLSRQANNEIRKERLNKLFIGRRKSVRQQQDNFIALASHYLNTPITILQGGVANYRHQKELSHEDSAMLEEHTAAMAKLVGQLSAKINTVDTYGSNHAPIPELKSPLTKIQFMLPVMLLSIVLILSVWLFGAAGILKPSLASVLTTIVGIILVVQVLASSLRNYQLHKAITDQSKLAVNEELRLEHARADFFQSATGELQSHLFAITSAIPKGSSHTVDEAGDRLLSLLDRMSLIGALTARGADYVMNTTPVDIHTTLNRLISDAKPGNVNVSLDCPHRLTADLDPVLFAQAVRPALDNAIKFSKEAPDGGTVVLSAHKAHGGLEIRLHDNGPGISATRRQQLFKPFSRGEDALRFNYEGAGLGLYLTKLSTELLGGNVAFAQTKAGTELVWRFGDVEEAALPSDVSAGHHGHVDGLSHTQSKQKPAHS